MKDQFAPLASYVPPGTWPYWMQNLLTGGSTPSGEWPQSSPPSAAKSSGGLLENFARPAGGALGNFAGPVEDSATAPWTAINGPMGWALTTMPSIFLPTPSQNNRTQHSESSQPFSGPNFPHLAVPAYASDQLNPLDNNRGVATPNAPEQPLRKPSVPFYGPGDALLPPPEPAPPAPPKDFRSWLRDALSDENTRYYLGPHLFDVFRKVHALTQLLPGSGTVQSTQDASRASEEAQAGNYGKAATHLGMGTLNAALDWVPPAKLAIIGGAMARTFPWDRLPTAMGVEAAGKSANNIWRETRLERDAAGNWTFEIPDKGYYVRPSADKQAISIAPLYEHHVHPGMQEAYPRLSRWRSRLVIDPLEEPGGATNFTKRLLEVRAPNLEWGRYVGIHELKHLIDKLEKHPPGGSPRQFLDRGLSEREAFDHYWRLVGEVAARNAQYRLHLSDRLRSLWPPQATERVPRSRQINLFDDDWQ